MRIALLFLLEYFIGSLMFAYWLGLLVKKDLRFVGDGNPGAYNLWSAAGYKLGLLAVFLEFFKGYFPLVIFIYSGYVKGFSIVPVAIAPVLGHAFPPFLKFKGGKTVAVTFGVWSAVTNFEISLVYAVILAIFSLAAKTCNKGKPVSTETDAFMVVLGMILVLIYLFIRAFSFEIIILCVLNILVIVFMNRAKLYSYYKLHFIK